MKLKLSTGKAKFSIKGSAYVDNVLVAEAEFMGAITKKKFKRKITSKSMSNIHPSAIVSSKAKIADDVIVGQIAIIQDDVEIDEDVRLVIMR